MDDYTDDVDLPSMPEPTGHCGYVAIVGRPNVGKSTLLNAILGQKLSITADKPQTTRHQIIGIKTDGENQAVYIDTPGLHLNAQRAINRYMNRAASSVLNDVDVVVFVVQALKWTDEDEAVLQRIRDENIPAILAVNKVDWVAEKERMLPYLQTLGEKHSFHSIVPISARKKQNIEQLESVITDCLPKNWPIYPEEQVTDRSIRFLAAELLREKLVRELAQELPYQTTVEIESFKEEEKLTRIGALIWVENNGQKSIIIGKQGSRLKSMSSKARIDMEALLERKVFLQVWVKVRQGWSDDVRALASLGYEDQ